MLAETVKQTPLESKVTDILTPVVTDLGYRLVCVRHTGESLQVLAENPETRTLGVDECARISRELSAILDVENLIDGFYRLEVSSPGIDRPLLSAEDFISYTGFEVKVEIEPGIEGRKRFRGVLKGIENGEVVLDYDRETARLPLESIVKAKLVLTDGLIRKTQQRQPEVKENGTAASR